MRILSVICWSAIMFALLFGQDMNGLLVHYSLSMEFIPNPEVHYFKPYSLNGDIILRKIGHFLAFAILQILIFCLTKNMKQSLVISLTIALASELIQPFFARDGRIIDVIVDSAGILVTVTPRYLSKFFRGAFSEDLSR